MKLLRLLLPLMGTLLFMSPLRAEGTIALTFETAAVVAVGATPRATVVFFGVAVEQGEDFVKLVRRDEVVTADASGVARYQLPEDVPRAAVWFAIDTVRMVYAVGTSQGFPLRVASPPLLLITPRDGATGPALQLSSTYAEVLVVRRGGNVWKESASKGGRKDIGSLPRAMLVNPAAFRPHGNGAALDRLTPGDVVISVDPYSLAFTVETYSVH
jgi:hypothetical protein